jgi:Zn finger protein HypA/HybF involved in hydrogenase expression
MESDCNQGSELHADDDRIRVRCTACGFVGTLDDFDVLFASEGNLFCNNCESEAPVVMVDEDGP